MLTSPMLKIYTTILPFCLIKAANKKSIFAYLAYFTTTTRDSNRFTERVLTFVLIFEIDYRYVSYF